IGFFIWNSYTNDKVGEVILALVYIGAVGLLLDRAVAFVQTLILPEEQK
ncbi:MAG: nitrate ABC transporter, permease protein, partial [Pseudanabaena sp.]